MVFEASYAPRWGVLAHPYGFRTEGAQVTNAKGSPKRKEGSMSLKRLSVISSLAGLAVAATSVPASADETFYCSAYIESVPYTISAPGHYCFNQDLSTNIPTGNAVSIEADFVTIDLNTFSLTNVVTGAETRAVGVLASNRTNITIKNGSVRGFDQGVVVVGSFSGLAGRHVIDGLTADASVHVGIVVEGPGSVVKNCSVTNTGGSTDPFWPGASGVVLNGSVVALNNSVTGTFANPNGSATSILLGPGNQLIVGNRIIGDGSAGSIGIRMVDSSQGYRDNIVTKVGTAYVGGSNLGNNQSF